MDHEVKIGYSFWGFLGPGVTDTPDGGRSHRRVLIDGLRSRGHDLVFLQLDRDYTEAGLDLSEVYTWDVGLSEIDVLFLEWRWPIPGRNTTWCGAAGHTCDLHRQQELLDHYTYVHGTLTILWDKDRQLPADDPLRTTGNVVVCEAAVHSTPGAVSLLFPVADAALAAADPAALAAMPRDVPLAYVGNQYDRDTAFDTFFAPAAASHRHMVAGKWTRTAAWPHVSFIGRVPFSDVAEIYGRTLATVLLLPDRYARVGQMTQRLAEAVLAGCVPLTPASIRGADRFTPQRLHVSDGAEVAMMLTRLRNNRRDERARGADRLLSVDAGRIPCVAPTRCARRTADRATWRRNGGVVIRRVSVSRSWNVGNLPARGQDRDHWLRRIRQDLPGQQTGCPAQPPADPFGRCLLRRRLEPVAARGVRRHPTRSGLGAAVDHRGQLRQHPSEQAGSGRHRDLPRSARGHLPDRDPPAQVALPRRPARSGRCLRPAYLELRSLHLPIPHNDAPPGSAAAGRAPWQRAVDHHDQPPAGGPIPRSTRRGIRHPVLTAPVREAAWR